MRLGVALYQAGIPHLRARIVYGRCRSCPPVLREAVVPSASYVAVLRRWCQETEITARTALPHFEWKPGSDFSDVPPPAATWTERDRIHKAGVIFGNEDFGQVARLISDLQKFWRPEYSVQIRELALHEIKASIVAKVAMFQKLTRSGWEAPAIREALSSGAVFAFAMVGLISEQECIVKKIAAQFGPPLRMQRANGSKSIDKVSADEPLD